LFQLLLILARVPPLPLLFNIVLEFLARAIRQKEGIQIGKGNVKFTDDRILYLKAPKFITPKLLDPINASAMCKDTKSTYKTISFAIHKQGTN
jgi:hypothetical protein